MGFEQVIGQSRAKQILSRALQNKRLPHAYLFSGAEGVGKEALAIELAKAIFCTAEEPKPCDQCSSCRRVAQFLHPDFFFIFPMPKNASAEEERTILDSIAMDAYNRERRWATPTISIDRIRELRRISSLKPLEGHRVIIIAEAEKMTAEAANALLKMLEEPPPAMHFILTTAQESALLPTIISRCQMVRFALLTDEEIAQALQQRKGLPPEQAQLIAGIAQGSYRRALNWLQESLQNRRELAIEFLRQCIKNEVFHYAFVEELIKNNERAEIRDLINLILLWFRDVLYAQIMQRSTNTEFPLINADKGETLNKFIAAFEKIDIDRAVISLEEAVKLIDRNVNLQLILVVLMQKLKKCLLLKGKSL